MLVNNRSDNIQVIVRTKPGVKGCVELDPVDSSRVKVGDREFFYDFVLHQTAQQEDVFQIIGLPLVTNALKGFNGCVFTYGQTGSGKTHTLIGDNDGILPKSLEYCFGSTYDKNKIIKASSIEIYNERIFDLLAGGDKQLQLREDLKLGTYVQDLTETVISNYEEALNLLKKGQINRHVAATKMNSESSRSHALFIIQYASSQEEEKYATHYSAKLNFVDLAGSERQKSAGTEGERLKEASAINKSLSNLGTVISSIVEVNKGKQLHIPYRDSKLTNLLKNCLGGNSKTFMLATINPEHVAETISTLKFADRVKQIRNKAQINKEITGEEVTKLQQQIKVLVLELEEKNKIIAEIQPADNLQFQLQQEFQNVKEILMSIHQLDVNQIESQCDAFNERKSIITQLLRNLNFPISFGNDILGQMEVESKLQCEIIQKDELIYKLQKKLRELEQKNYDQQNFYKIIQQQQQRNYEEQLKHKEDMIFQLKDDVDTSEISKYTLQRQLDELNLKFNQFNQESMFKQGDILVEEQLIRDQENTIKDQLTQIEQMCARFESLKLQFTQVQETVIYKEEQVAEELLKVEVRDLRCEVIVLEQQSADFLSMQFRSHFLICQLCALLNHINQSNCDEYLLMNLEFLLRYIQITFSSRVNF